MHHIGTLQCMNTHKRIMSASWNVCTHMNASRCTYVSWHVIWHDTSIHAGNECTRSPTHTQHECTRSSTYTHIPAVSCQPQGVHTKHLHKYTYTPLHTHTIHINIVTHSYTHTLNTFTFTHSYTHTHIPAVPCQRRGVHTPRIYKYTYKLIHTHTRTHTHKPAVSCQPKGGTPSTQFCSSHGASSRTPTVSTSTRLHISVELMCVWECVHLFSVCVCILVWGFVTG